jgi:hypothetical protein
MLNKLSYIEQFGNRSTTVTAPIFLFYFCLPELEFSDVLVNEEDRYGTLQIHVLLIKERIKALVIQIM